MSCTPADMEAVARAVLDAVWAPLLVETVVAVALGWCLRWVAEPAR